MIGRGILWAAFGYLAGTFPSTWLVAKAKGASELMERSGRSSSETDPHILMVSELGVGWTALAATLVSTAYLDWSRGLLTAALVTGGSAVIVGATGYLLSRPKARRLVWPEDEGGGAGSATVAA